ALQGERIVVQINTGIFFKGFCKELDQTHIEVFTTEEGITVGGQHFELVLAIYVGNFNNRDIEGTATEIVYSNSAIAFAFIQAISQSSSSRFVDNALYVQSGN